MLGAEMVRLSTALTRTPLVLSFHNDLIGDGARAALFARYQRLSAHLTVRSAAALCAVSLDHYRSSRLRQMLGETEPPIIDVPNGVDTALFRPLGLAGNLRAAYRIPTDARLLLFVAALDRAHHFKGLPTLLAAMPYLPSNTWLLVVGDGDLRATYEQQAAHSATADRIVFAGSIPHEQTPVYFRCADLTVLPSTPPESFGLVLIESLACGTPVVASNIPGVRTVVDDGRDGWLALPGDPAALAVAIRRILGDESTRLAMGRHGRDKVVARYSWEQIGARLEQLYMAAIRDARAWPPTPARDLS
jgi:glycosyltransferase involved in cell wall biosynthesis